ncbi:MAG: hypothetical protein IKR86_06730, partial [Candidatus Methanomethylophilaceae archaeon]|nr:hypothetical protein [Candidatus Methanomethylophilaceae archaeon]
MIIVAALGILAGMGLIHGGGDDPAEHEFTASDASQIAASFSEDYDGFFGENFYLADGWSEAEAKDFYPNGSTTGYGSDSNYVTFFVLKDKSAAKSEFEKNKTDYSAQIGKTVMGSVVKGAYYKAVLDDAIGYYSNFTKSVPSGYIYYTGYLGNAFFESYIYLSGQTISENQIDDYVAAICDAIKNPVPVTRAKIYVEPVEPTGPTIGPDGKVVGAKCAEYTITDAAGQTFTFDHTFGPAALTACTY